MNEKAPQDTESRHADKYIVRFPAGMRERLKAEAAVNNRTLNAEIVLRLQESLNGSKQTAWTPPFDLSALLAKMREDQKVMVAKTSLQMALMQVENATTATRGLTVEIRELKQALSEAERAGLPAQEVDALRHKLRLAEHLLPQHHELIRAAREEVQVLQPQVAALENELKERAR